MMFLDSAFAEKKSTELFSLGKINSKSKSTLFSRGKRTESFFTNDSGLYLTHEEQRLIKRGIKIRTGVFGIDGAFSRVVDNYRYFRPAKNDVLYKNLVKRYAKLQENIADVPRNVAKQLSLVKLWNFSMVGAVILGMISMTLIYRYLGVGVYAEGDTGKLIGSISAPQVLGAEDIKNNEETVKYIEDAIAEINEAKKNEFEEKIRKMVKGYPIEKMLPYIIEKDQIVTAFLIGIARKESSWGVHVPVYNDQDCYNYWGYRGPNRVGSGGHSCFASRKEAVDTVAKRLKYLIEDRKLDTPDKLVIWKCGSACSSDDQAAVRKWISDVDLYFEKLND